MALLGMALSLTVAALAVVLVGADVISLADAANLAFAASAAFVACLALTLLVDWIVTRAFRRLEPDAKSTFFQTLFIVNALWIGLLVAFAPRFTRTALEAHGAWMVPSGSARVQSAASRLAALIPRSEAVNGATPV